MGRSRGGTPMCSSRDRSVVLPFARNLNVLTVRLASSLSCAVHPDLLITFFNSLLDFRMPPGYGPNRIPYSGTREKVRPMGWRNGTPPQRYRTRVSDGTAASCFRPSMLSFVPGTALPQLVWGRLVGTSFALISLMMVSVSPAASFGARAVSAMLHTSLVMS